MIQVFENIEANKLSTAMKRRGILSHQRVHVVVRPTKESYPLARTAEQGGAFDWLADEPDIYTTADIK
jgi:hypothetical protein